VKTAAKQRARLKMNVVGMPEKGNWRMRRRRGRMSGRRKIVRILFSSIFYLYLWELVLVRDVGWCVEKRKLWTTKFAQDCTAHKKGWKKARESLYILFPLKSYVSYC
jgi:hypothetical protein